MSEKSWLSTEPGIIQLPKQIIKAAIILLFISLATGLTTFYIMGAEPPARPDMEELTTLDFSTFALILFVFLVVEEIAFRLVPIAIGMLVCKNLGITIFICLISSVICGYLHGNEWNILSQGVISFCYCLYYLKFGGRNKKIIKPFISIVFVHSLLNSAILIPMYFLHKSSM